MTVILSQPRPVLRDASNPNPNPNPDPNLFLPLFFLAHTNKLSQPQRWCTTVLNVSRLASRKTRFFNPLLGKPDFQQTLVSASSACGLPHTKPWGCKKCPFHPFIIFTNRPDKSQAAMVAQWQHGTAFSPDKTQLNYTFCIFFCYQLIFCSRCFVLISKDSIVSWRFDFHEQQLNAMHPINVIEGCPIAK